MIFNSLYFIIFFPAIIVLYYLTPERYRWALLLAASYYFYMAWKPGYAILILIATTISYVAGLMIYRSGSRKKKLSWLTASLAATLGILFYFKYYNFSRGIINASFDYASLSARLPALNVLLPVGISFFTFQALSYTIEIYRGRQKPESHFGIFALYISFFPKLIAGPIERPYNLLPQLKDKFRFDYYLAADGLKLMAWGLFKKIVIADRLALVVNAIYGNPKGYDCTFLGLATLFFSLQIYCDFSGYSDIAIGAAQVFGVRLMDNFTRPYLAPSIPDFWRRWHISLSTWFRDYLYIPLGGNRVPRLRQYLNILVVFLLCGLWHGANWTFVTWGALHAVFMIVTHAVRTWRGKSPGARSTGLRYSVGLLARILFTFAVVSYAWIFFRADTMSDAVYIATNIFRGWGASFSRSRIAVAFGNTGVPKAEYVISFILIAILLGVQLLQSRRRIRDLISSKPWWVRWLIYYAGVAALLIYGKYERSPFIYSQF